MTAAITGPVTIAAVEQAMLERLQAAVPDLQDDRIAAEVFPEAPDQYRLTHPVAALLVMYGGSRFSEPVATGAVVQTRRLEFDVVVMAKSRRTHTGAVELLAQARRALTGWRAPGCDPAFPVREVLTGQDQGVWTYTLTIAMDSLHLEDLPAEEGVPLTSVTVGSDMGQSVTEEEA